MQYPAIYSCVLGNTASPWPTRSPPQSLHLFEDILAHLKPHWFSTAFWKELHTLSGKLSSTQGGARFPCWLEKRMPSRLQKQGYCPPSPCSRLVPNRQSVLFLLAVALSFQGQSSSQSQRETMPTMLYKGLHPDGGGGLPTRTNGPAHSCQAGRASVFFPRPGYWWALSPDSERWGCWKR